MVESLELKSKNAKIYSIGEVEKATLNYFNGDALATDKWITKYALEDRQKNLHELDPSHMHKRMASEIARIEKKYKNPIKENQIFDLFDHFRHIIPGGSNMAGIGNIYQITSLSNCFVIGNKADSYGGICLTDQEQIQLMKRRGGVGHDLSHIRPTNSEVMNSARTSTGQVSYMERFSNSTGEVAQGGRRGALMLSTEIKHPDAKYFITAKRGEGKITNANVSVKIDDEFMTALRDGKKYVQQFPTDSDHPTVKIEIDPHEVWDKIVDTAWDWGEPGVLFWDTITKESIPDCYSEHGFTSISTNPCGEIPLCPDDSCRLASLNLMGYVKNPYTSKAEFDFNSFNRDAGYAHRIMDDIVDLEIERIEKILTKVKSDPEEYRIKAVEIDLWKRIKDRTSLGRRTGIGITAEGDMLAALGLKYGTDKATKFATEVHKNLALSVYRSSVELAKERGAFEIYNPEKEKNNPFIQRIKKADPQLYDDMVKYGRRNISLLTIAPNGTTSIMAQTSSGIEPAIKILYKRKTKVNKNDPGVKVDETDSDGNDWQNYIVFHHGFENWLNVNGYNPEEVKNLEKEKMQEIIKKSPYYGATSEDVNWVNKVKMQGSIQKWVDHSISATTNLPKEASKELVSKLYQTAWESGCKGMTIFREGCKKLGILTGLEKEVVLVQNNVELDPRLERKAQSMQYKIARPQNRDNLHVGLSSDLYVDDKTKKSYFIPDQIFQARTPLGHATTVSFAQSGIDRTEVFRGDNPDYAEFVKRLQSPTSNESEGMGPRKIKSIEHAVGLVLEDYLLINGVIGHDPKTNEIINLIRKPNLRKVKVGSDEYKAILSQVRFNSNGDNLKITGNGNTGAFECPKCNETIPKFEAGCNSPICASCGFAKDGCE